MKLKCPYCHKLLYDQERYCSFCDADLSKKVDEKEKPKLRK